MKKSWTPIGIQDLGIDEGSVLPNYRGTAGGWKRLSFAADVPGFEGTAGVPGVPGVPVGAGG
jgi:hypothetical protein